MRVTAAVVDELGGPFGVEELGLDEPGPGEALVRVVAAGIAEFAPDHLTTPWGERVVGTLGGSGRGDVLIGALVELHRQGRFPFDRLVRFYELADIDRALADSRSGEVLKPVLRMKH
jgi:Zn-dependent alcohol dehydrogenase